jgi:hypothetical protein
LLAAGGMNQTVINTIFPGEGPSGIRTIAKGANLSSPIDLFSLFQKHCPVVAGTPGHAPSKSQVKCALVPDACHPSNEGYLKVAAEVKATISHS